MFTARTIHQTRRFPMLFMFLLALTLTVPAAVSAGIVMIPVLGFSAGNTHGDRLGIQLEGNGPDLTGMIGRVRFRDSTTGQRTTVVITDSTHAVGSSILILLDQQGTPVVEIDLTGVSLTWLPTGTTFESGIDEINFRLTSQSFVVPD